MRIKVARISRPRNLRASLRREEGSFTLRTQESAQVEPQQMSSFWLRESGEDADANNEDQGHPGPPALRGWLGRLPPRGLGQSAQLAEGLLRGRCHGGLPPLVRREIHQCRGGFLLHLAPPLRQEHRGRSHACSASLPAVGPSVRGDRFQGFRQPRRLDDLRWWGDSWKHDKNQKKDRTIRRT